MARVPDARRVFPGFPALAFDDYFASSGTRTSASPKNRYNNIINVQYHSRDKKGKKNKKKLQDKETITRYSILQSILLLKIKTKDIIILNHEFNIIECIG